MIEITETVEYLESLGTPNHIWLANNKGIFDGPRERPPAPKKQKYSDHQHPKREELNTIFNLTAKEALNPRILNTRNKLKIHEKRKEQLLGLCIRASKKDYWLPKAYHEEESGEVQKIRTRLDHLNRRRKYLNELERYNEAERRYQAARDQGQSTQRIHRPREPRREYSKSQAKEYPIKRILQESGYELDSFNKFRIRRGENTASCVLYPNNTAYDFGSGKYYDSIEIKMEVDGLNFIEALRELQN